MGARWIHGHSVESTRINEEKQVNKWPSNLSAGECLQQTNPYPFLFFVELLDRKNHRTAKSCILSPTPMIHRTLFCYTPRRCRSTEPEGSRVIVSLNKSKEIYIYNTFKRISGNGGGAKRAASPLGRRRDPPRQTSSKEGAIDGGNCVCYTHKRGEYKKRASQARSFVCERDDLGHLPLFLSLSTV